MRSFALILLALALSLSTPGIRAEKNQSTAQLKSNQPPQPPAPTPSKDSQKQKNYSRNTNENAASDPRGTDKQPFVVQSLEAEKTPERIIQETREREEKSANEERIIFWAMVSAITAAFLGLIAAGQLWMFRRQLGYIRESLADTKAAVESAAMIAKTAREEFISTHRPKLIVRGVSVKTLRGTGIPDVLEAKFIIANIGDTPATIIEISSRIWFPKIDEDLPAIPPYRDSECPSQTIESGMSFPWTSLEDLDSLAEFDFVSGFYQESTQWSEPIAGHARMYVVGYIVYEDGMKRRRRTAFLRQYNFQTKRFITLTDPDYEYQD